MIRRPPRSTLSSSSAASDVYKRQHDDRAAEHSRTFESLLEHSRQRYLLTYPRHLGRVHYFFEGCQVGKFLKNEKFGRVHFFSRGCQVGLTYLLIFNFFFLNWPQRSNMRSEMSKVRGPQKRRPFLPSLSFAEVTSRPTVGRLNIKTSRPTALAS